MFLLYLLSRLPLPVLYLISNFLYWAAYHIIGYRRKLVRRNLANSFPEKSLKEIVKIEKQFYRNLCDYGMETIKLLTISPKELTLRVDSSDLKKVTDYIGKNQPVIVLASHIFNWEWLLVANSISEPLDFVYQKQSNNFFSAFSTRCRTRFGAYAIEREKVGRELAIRRNKLRIIANVADQFPGHGQDKKFYASFLHQKTAFFYGINGLAQATQYPVFFANSIKTKRGYFKCVFTEIGTPPYTKDDNRVLHRFIEELEKAVKQQPDNWLWSHNRWKVRD